MLLRLCGGVALASQNVPSSYTCAFMKMCKDGKGNPVGEPVKSTADTWSIWTPGRSVRWTWGYIYNPNIGHFNRTMKWPSLWFAFLINPRIGRPLSKFAAEAMGGSCIQPWDWSIRTFHLHTGVGKIMGNPLLKVITSCSEQPAVMLSWWNNPS